ncbi:MAG TPA: histidine kinase dimerization/phospho-acceptor domain-containing protein, partial [Cyclobacteriaceae bacterium]|nr:histidine kinase dimerization/phospho-acceptor domain-containing protein [Cyclobacteriaceae bacterium]
MDLFSNDIKIDDFSSAVRLFRESREGFVKLFNTSPVCMSMTTTTLGRRAYVRANQKFLSTFGYTEDEIVGRTSVEIGILDQAESDRVRQLITEKGRLQNDYVKCIAKDGHLVHTISSIEFMEMNGEQYLVSFFVDVSRVVNQQAIIEQHARQLEALNKELESFSYSVSHDLRAPLRAINGYIKILEEDFTTSLDEEGKRLLATVQRNALKMDMLISDLLNFSKLGKLPVNKRTIDMSSLVSEVLAELRHTTSDRADVRIGTLHALNGDYTLIRQVMVNLLGNALKYSSKHEAPVVEISSTADDNIVTYEVRDNGAGFDMKYAEKLFGVFQRLHKTSEFEGTG